MPRTDFSCTVTIVFALAVFSLSFCLSVFWLSISKKTHQKHQDYVQMQGQKRFLEQFCHGNSPLIGNLGLLVTRYKSCSASCFDTKKLFQVSRWNKEKPIYQGLSASTYWLGYSGLRLFCISPASNVGEMP